MPVLEQHFGPAVFHSNGHLSTIATALLRQPPIHFQFRERITLRDGDFIDLDWIRDGHPKLMVLIHGLEGNSSSGYIKGMADVALSCGMDVVAMNLRGCSGEMNILERSYHSGATEDVEEIVEHLLMHYKYQNINICGFSLGGNLVLKYVGEKGSTISPRIEKAMAVSVPVDLKDSALTLCNWENTLYHQRFLIRLKSKMKEKSKLIPKFPFHKVMQAKNLIEFDHFYTAPAHGFKDAWDYYQQASSLFFLRQIKVPTLLLNAKNDPFFTDKCIPIAEANENPNLYLMVTPRGGHVGFKESKGNYFSEKIAHSFFSNQLF